MAEDLGMVEHESKSPGRRAFGRLLLWPWENAHPASPGLFFFFFYSCSVFPKSQLHSSRLTEVFFQWTHRMTTTAPRLRFSVQGHIVSTLGWSCSYNNLLKDVMKR